MSASKFATRHGLKENTLTHWIREFREPSEERRADGEFAEVVLRDGSARGGIEIVLSHGRVIRVEGEVDIARLRAVVEVLESC